MNRALLYLFSIAALILFGASAASAQDCQNPANANNSAADINGDGCVDGDDDSAMQAAMASGDPAGDLDGSGTVNVTDWNLFIQARNS